jgi:Na+/H+ antiporter NhaA
LEGNLLDAAKVGIIVGSFLSAIIGLAALVLLLPKSAPDLESQYS